MSDVDTEGLPSYDSFKPPPSWAFFWNIRYEKKEQRAELVRCDLVFGDWLILLEPGLRSLQQSMSVRGLNENSMNSTSFCCFVLVTRFWFSAAPSVLLI